MALSKRTYVGDTTIITAANLNDIQDSIIALESAGDDGTHPAYYIDLVGNYPNYTCPVAMADIKAAYEAGKVLKCRFAMEQYTATLPLSIPMPSANTWIFSGAGAGGADQQISCPVHQLQRRRSGRHLSSRGNHLRGGPDHRQLLPPADQRLLPMLGQRVTDQVDRAGDVRREKRKAISPPV